MFKYIFKQYVRSISRRKLFSFINITGLAFGIAFILMIGQFLFYEFNYNHQVKNADNIYRLADENRNGYMADNSITDEILKSIPGIKNACLLNNFAVDADINDKYFKISHMLIVDSNFFNIFNVKFISGDPKTSIASIKGVVLTESTAKRLFGSTNVIGKTIRLEHEEDMLVTGIVKDLPDNLSFKAELFVNYLNSPKKRLVYTEWGYDKTEIFPFNIFILLDKNADVLAIEKGISSLYETNKFGFPQQARLVPLKTNYFYTKFNDFSLEHGNVALVKLLSAIGLIILLLAVINFINLTTAAYKYRLTEIGVKKCFGANRRNLIYQLLTESFFTCLIASVIGIGLAELFLPYFNQFSEKPMTLRLFTDYRLLGLFLIFIPLLSLICALLPALIFSRITPIQLFRTNQYLKGSGKNYRGFLTMIQFAVTIILISSLIIIFKQINFVKHADIGFNTDHLIDLKVHYTLRDKMQVLSNKLNEYHGMKSLSITNGVPGTINLTVGGYAIIVVDTAAVKTFGFRIVKGRDLRAGDAGKACLINEEALAKLKASNERFDKINGSEIVGVVADFHYSSLYKKTGPLILSYNPAWGANNITMRVAGPIGKTIKYIKSVWEEVCPGYPLEIDFYNDSFAAMYSKEEHLASLLSIFSVLAVIISCLGIFGLSVFQSEQKIKEIGIRKVMGAASYEILILLTKDFSKWVIFANVIAIPVAYYLMSKWLQDFAYRIEMQWWMFAISGLIAVVIALITVSFQAIKAATANPVKSLRYE